jgi:hypothetical protein
LSVFDPLELLLDPQPAKTAAASTKSSAQV